jgi:hypothetical protein
VPEIKIRVGAALDASVQKTFDTAEKAAAKAAARTQKAWEKSARDQVRTQEKADRETSKLLEKKVREEQRAANAIAREEQRSVRQRERENRQLTREVEQEARRRVQAERQAMREIERELAQHNRTRVREAAAAAREAERRSRQFFGGGGGRIGIGRRAAIGVSRGAAVLYGYGGAAAASQMRALGVETNLGALANRGVENQALAQTIINAAPSTTGMSVPDRQAAAASLLSQSKQVATGTATDTSEVLDSLRAFVAKTGDLDTARKVIGDIATMSKATGSSLEDMGSAAAEIANHLGDVPDKAASTMAVMRAIAGQGKLGAVEMRDMSTQMAKLASSAQKFEGGIEKNIALMGVLAQESKLTGGSASSSQAATAVMRFAAGMSNKTLLKHWAAEGIRVFADEGNTKLRSAPELILEAINATKGNQAKLAQLFPSGIGVRAVQGFAAIYSEHGGGKAGLEAVAAEFRRLSSAAMTQEEVTRAFSAQMDLTQSKVQRFNNEMQQTVEQLQNNAIPAFEALAPIVLDVAKGLSGFLDTVLGGRAPKEAAQAQGAESGALNFISKLRSFEQTNVESGPMIPGLADPAAVTRNLALAAPVLASGEEQAERLRQEINKFEGKARSERTKRGAWGVSLEHLSEEEIAEAAAGRGNYGSLARAASEQYLADKSTAARLHDTMDKMVGAIDQLRSALTSGQVQVKLPPGGTRARTGGSMPADSPEPE